MKTKLTSYDLKEMFKELYTDNDYGIVIQEQNGSTKNSSIVEYLNTTFYTYDFETKEHNIFESEDGFNFPNLDNFIHSMGNISSSYALVELQGLEVVASSDIDMGSATANITFVMQSDKMDLFEQYIADLRLKTMGVENSFRNSENKIVSCYLNVGDLSYENEEIITIVGKCIIARLTFSIAYIENTQTSNSSNILISLNGTDYYNLKYSQMTQDIIFNGKTNIPQNKPYASGLVVASVSITETITYWIFKNARLQIDLNELVKATINDLETYTDELNIPVWIMETIPSYDVNDALTTKTIATKFVISNYKTTYKNSDFVSVSLSLTRYSGE